MSKNLIRKGLAFGALVALASSAFAGTAASATSANELTIAPSTGTQLGLPAKNVFKLKTFVSAGFNGNLSSLKYKVTTTGGFPVQVNANTALASAAVDREIDPTNTTPDESDLVVAATAVSGTLSASTTNTISYLAVGIPDDLNDSGSTIVYTGTTRSVTITPFIDNDASGAVNGSEWSGAAITVKFLKDADLSWTATMDTPAYGDTEVTSWLKSTTVNLSQLSQSTTGQVAFEQKDNAGTPNVVETVASYDEDEDALTASGSFSVTNKTYTSQAFFSASDDTAANVVAGAIKAGDAVVKTVAARTIATLDAVASKASTSNTVTASNAGKVKTGATSLKVYTIAKDSTPAIVKDLTVTFTIKEKTAAGFTGTIVAGGKTLSNTNGGTVQSITATAVTDADGVATLTLALSGLKDTEQFVVDASAEGISAGTTNETTYTIADATAGTLADLNAIGESSNVLTVAKDAAFTMEYSIVDQYGAALTSSASSVVAVYVSDDNFSTTRATAVATGSTVKVVVPAYTTAVTKTISAKVYVNGSATSVTSTQVVVVGTAATAAAVTVPVTNLGTSSSKTSLNAKTFTAADTRKGEIAQEYTASSNHTVAGQVTDANGNGIAATVVLSGSKLNFIADGVYTNGSITVNTEADGSYSVDVLSNYAGAHTLTATVGSVTKTVTAYFADADDESGKTLTVTVPSIVKSGNALVVRGSLVDAFGNPVTADGTGEDLNVTYAGPGFAGTIPTSVDADGTFRFYVLLGSNDFGSAKVTVGYDLDEDGDYSDTGDILVSKVVLVGVSAKITKAATSSAVVKNALGETVKIVRGTKSKTLVATSNSQKVTLKGGKGTVKAYVNGVLVASKK